MDYSHLLNLHLWPKSHAIQLTCFANLHMRYSRFFLLTRLSIYPKAIGMELRGKRNPAV